jgi:predicted dehydrogenase
MIKAIGPGGGRIFLARVNPGPIGDHWSNTHKEGGRILGEAVHFFDLCNWFMESEPAGVSASYMGDISVTNANMTLIAKYPDGSLGQVIYTTAGDKEMGKERFEAYGRGRSVISDDYKHTQVYGAGTSISRRDRGNKGHLAELEEFAAAIRDEPYPVRGADARAGTVAVWMAQASLESAEEEKTVKLDI